MPLFEQRQQKRCVLCWMEPSLVQIYDVFLPSQASPSLELIHASKGPLLEGAKRVNTCIKSQGTGPGDDPQALSCPEVAVGSDLGLHFMNVRISRLAPRMNSVYLKEEQSQVVGEVLSLA